jgi:hypothetical protein
MAERASPPERRPDRQRAAKIDVGSLDHMVAYVVRRAQLWMD